MHNDFDPDDNFANSFRTDHDIDDEAALEQVVWQLLLLINPGDEDAARQQFDAWQELMTAGAGDPVERLGDAIDWKSGFRVDEGDTSALVESLDELAARWNLRIDWGVEDPGDGEFLRDADAEHLLQTAYDRLREHHYTLWLHDAGSDRHAGWITRSDDNEAMRLIASAMGIDLRPGGS